MRRAGGVIGTRDGSYTGMKFFVPFKLKIVLVSKIMMKSGCKTVFYMPKKF